MAFNLRINPQVNNLTIAGGTTQTAGANIITFTGTAVFNLIENKSSGSVEVYLNDLSTSFTLSGNSVISFNTNELHVNKIAFSNATSGASSVYITVISGVVND